MYKSFFAINKWEQFRRRTTPVLFPIAYYFRPFTITTGRFPPISVIAQFSYKDLDRQTIMEKRSFDRLQQWLVKRLLRRPQIMAEQVTQGRRFAERWLQWCRKSLTPENLRKVSHQDLSYLYRRYQQDYEQYSMINIFYWVFAGDRLIEGLDKAIAPIVPQMDKRQQIVQQLTTPDIPSFIQKEELTFFRLAKGAPTMAPASFNKVLSNHSLKFGWIPWDYVGPTYWSAAALRRRMAELLRNSNFKVQINNIKRHLRQIRMSRIATERELKLPNKIKALAAATRWQAVLQDDKKAITTESHYYLHFLHQEAGRRLRVPWRHLYFASFEEIISAFGGKRLPNSVRRSKHGIFFMHKGELNPVEGKKAVLWLSKITQGVASNIHELHGTPASHGLVTGRVSIVLLPKDMEKVRNGDVLVTQMTTPEYVPAMKRAAGFVTDEGGLTCHAAIVSREMKKPCIIGTKIATQVLKDGDRVEVDAIRGIIKKL